jgi:hypothetical protein
MVCALALGVRRVRRRGTWRTRGARERHQGVEARRERRADPFDAPQVRQRAKRPALFAVGDDAPRHHRADSGEHVQLRRRCHIDVDPGVRQHAFAVIVRRSPRGSRVGPGQSVRRQSMAPPTLPRGALSLPRLRAPRRIDRGELTVQRAGIDSRHFVDRAHGSEGTDRSAEQADAGEEEQRFLFGGSWHDATVMRHAPSPTSNQRSAYRKSRPNESRASPRRRRRPGGSAPRPCRRCPAGCDADCPPPARTQPRC